MARRYDEWQVDHKRTFFFLEQLILKHKVHNTAIRVAEVQGGLDFYFASKSHAIKFVEFLSAVLGVRYKTSERLISADTHSNTANFKFTFSVEIPPVCKDDLICLPKKIAARLGNIGQLVLCWRVSNLLQIVDPRTLLSTSSDTCPGGGKA